MSKIRDLFEHLKTGILVVLFLITILLLYLNLNQNGTDFSLSDILKGKQSTNIVVSVDDQLNPLLVARSDGEGFFSLCSSDAKTAFDTANNCAKNLLPATNGKFTKISYELFIRMALEEGAIQLVFGFDYPIDEYCELLIDKTLEHPEDFEGFNILLFSHSIKSDLYFKTSKGDCYKFSVAENYYSTEAMEKVLTFDQKVDYNNLYDALVENNTTLEGFNFDEIPERIFGDTFDFVRRITDGNGNRTYMYGYGQKRLSVYTDGSLEFKEDITATEKPEFYSSLGTALVFVEEKTGIDDGSLRLLFVHYNEEEQSYEFIFEIGEYRVHLHVVANGVNYFSMGRSV